MSLPSTGSAKDPSGLRPCPFSPDYAIGEVEAWRAMQTLLAYQILLIALLLVLVPLHLGPSVLASHNINLYISTCLVYLALLLGSVCLLQLQRPGYRWQASIRLTADIFALTLIMHASGGVRSGLGSLIAVTIAGAGILVGGRCALALAAAAALLMLGEQVYAEWHQSFSETAYSYAGILGIGFMTTALIAYQLSLMAERNAALARQRGLDLANLEQLNAYIIQHLQSGIMVVDATQRIRLMNQSAMRLLGLRRQPTALPWAHTLLAERFADWVTSVGDPTCEITQPSLPTLHVQFVRHAHSDDTIYILLIEDAALVNQRLQHNKLVSLHRLTVSIAHELRNPLSAIRQAGQLLSEHPDELPADPRLVDIIQRNCLRINEIIENILMISRRNSARVETIRLTPWLEAFLRDFHFQHQTHAEQIRLCGDTELMVLADPSQLKQILDNLCSNALKYGANPARPVLLQALHRVEEGAPVVEVCDFGPGIKPETAKHLFEPFFTTSYTGTGLGLYIARELAELNQAQLHYVANPEGGSCFRLTLLDAQQQRIAL